MIFLYERFSGFCVGEEVGASTGTFFKITRGFFVGTGKDAPSGEAFIPEGTPLIVRGFFVGMYPGVVGAVRLSRGLLVGRGGGGGHG